ncbi:MAG: methionyl-tRNA formyltransferase, partial [Bacteroidota bacterium]
MKPRIVFMGTPEFAVPSLEALIENGYEVVGVVTATDKMGGRGGKKLLESAVKKCAIKHQIPVLQPTKLRDPDFLADLRRWNTDLQIVVAFRMLPELVWDMPSLGTFNLHGSLLPKYRGAAPINWAIINGEAKTGLTTFFIKHEIDTGDMLLQAETPIGPNETAGDLHDRMMVLGADLVVDTVKLIETGSYHLQKQDDRLACPAPKLSREVCQIDFDQSCNKVHDFIRGLSPYPAAWTRASNQIPNTAVENDQHSGNDSIPSLGLQDLKRGSQHSGNASTRGSTEKTNAKPSSDPANKQDDKRSESIKIFDTRPIVEDHNHPVGTLITDGKREIKIACRDGYIEVLKLQISGR